MSDTQKEGRTSVPTQSNHQAEALSVSERCDLLASDRRRAVLRYLAARPNQTVSVVALADHLVAEAATDERQTVILSLQHVHLPKLADLGVIAYERDQRQLSYRNHTGLEKLLSFVEEKY